ncbi:MAG: hypothetical protein HOM58_14260 [Rhodospirillaceae bacterium]|jgi:hypothetical protein|nr:hypothetical protein [Rhodospirillaceae bacterium]
MTPSLSVFVNTCDAYEDCWAPFFQLFERYWQGPPPQIILNTEEKTFAYSGLDITCTQVGLGRDGGRISWGEQLRRGLAKVQNEIVLYMHEDFFLQAPVDIDTIQKCHEVIRSDRTIAAIRLHELGGSGPWTPSEHPFLWEVAKKSPYRVSLQAGFWRTERLGSFVRPHENPWQFEIWGSKRLRWRRDRVLCMNRDQFVPETHPVLPYPCDDTVKKGKWNRDIVCDLFASNGIEVDFAKRGFLEPNIPDRKDPLARRVFARARSIV